jgi:hypothetical protein
MNRFTASLVGILMCCAALGRAAEFTMERDEAGVTVRLDGKVFTRYHVLSGTKPVLWPVIGPTGKEMTRAYPLRKAGPDERPDHIHHRSLWFTHGDVNGCSFWHEDGSPGKIVHRQFLDISGGPDPSILTRNDWVNNDGETVCHDTRRLTFGANDHKRWIDFDVRIEGGDKPVKFGDTKEGTFGVRVPGSMKVDAGQGGKIINREGKTNRDTWGKRSSWVDYSGPVDGQILGVAILNHPSSFRYPTYWHVRTYGLFAANPFGLHNFENSSRVDGSHTVPPGKSFTLRYRVLLHIGDEKEGKVAEEFAAYSKVPKEGP